MSQGPMSLAKPIKLLTILLICILPTLSKAEAAKRPLITQPIDEQNLVTVGGVRPEVSPANDRGPVADNLLLDHMYLQLRRMPERDREVKELIDRLHDPKAPEYHHWLTVEQIEKRFGPDEQDLRIITGWLESHGLRVNVVYRANGVIDFSGPAGAVRSGFHTEVHNLSVKGEAHIANVSSVKIPAALAPAIVGVVSMNDFRPRPASHRRSQIVVTSPGGYYAVTPGDIATIYNFNPVFAAGIAGKGQTVVAVEDSNLYSPDDWTKFRKTFGLSQNFPYGSFSQIHPQPTNNPDNGGPCADPGVNPDGDDFEATLDAEYASAAAPNAAVVLATCANTNTNFGGYIALQNLFAGGGKPPAIVSISYGESEPFVQATGVGEGIVPVLAEAYINELYETGVMQGVSIFVAAGDEGGASGDSFDDDGAEQGIAVNGQASTPNNVAVGGTDFGDYYLGETSTYWSSTNGKYFNSALSYVPEIAWNSTCGSQLLANFLGYATTYGADGLCNSALGEEYWLTVYAGSGGASSCATGVPSIYGSGELSNGEEGYAVVSGTCRGFPKPAYQRIVTGNPSDGVRDLPDVSLFSASGLWYHIYVLCFSDPDNYGVPCVGGPATWAVGGGTSFATPIMAGVQALLNEVSGGYQGNPNYVYYALGALEYDFGGASACDATRGNKVNPGCIFHDVTLGDDDVPCVPLVADGTTIGTFNCYLTTGTYGVLSLSNTAYEPAYEATPAWDFTTGLGSVNVYNLLRAWPGSRLR